MVEQKTLRNIGTEKSREITQQEWLNEYLTTPHLKNYLDYWASNKGICVKKILKHDKT